MRNKLLAKKGRKGEFFTFITVCKSFQLKTLFSKLFLHFFSSSNIEFCVSWHLHRIFAKKQVLGCILKLFANFEVGRNGSKNGNINRSKTSVRSESLHLVKKGQNRCTLTSILHTAQCCKCEYSKRANVKTLQPDINIQTPEFTYIAQRKIL